MTNSIHISKYGTYHPAPDADVTWTIHDTRGYLDGGSPCDECSTCDCSMQCESCLTTLGHCNCDDMGCCGLAFSYVCLDGGDNLCEVCAKTDPNVPEIVPCDCP